MIALINLLNVNRVQNQRTGRLNHSPPITTGVELSPTAATGRFFFFLRRALGIKISGRAHADRSYIASMLQSNPFIRTLKGP